jgi:DNA-directed RNA polymerase specialized sigma subunit
MDMFASVDATRSLEEEERRMRKKLAKFALDEFRTELIILRFVYDMTFQQIAQELNSPSVQTLFYAYSTAIKMLNERRFK